MSRWLVKDKTHSSRRLLGGEAMRARGDFPERGEDMALLKRHDRSALNRWTGDRWRERLPIPGRSEPAGPPRSLVITGLVAVGLGLLAWHYIGRDLRRYLKIYSM
jgi:hypothetical protein